ncbi:hypothetical protein LUZ63_010576 [Rhynchospora breviuscula]|uniref:Neprosin PEP catalytic domain-containing protein n=1 Tax=Rhynchospora breviuscula TaxID=2022672 RepID=A0A9Q0CH94_9POAL|nr:hypothetical protein LUZ63_010576 [Rhynchospora breviuscula]
MASKIVLVSAIILFVLNHALAENKTELAGYRSKGQLGKWHGVRAKINVWPINDVLYLSRSSAYIAVHNGAEQIAAGVHVYPEMYKDYNLRFFTYWTAGDGAKRGCYNLDCPGFVLADGTNLHPGNSLYPLSDIFLGMRYITLRIKKDENTGDWSLYREDKGGPIGGMTLVGWWPKTLFNGLVDSGNEIEWTGSVFYPSDETPPTMGSSLFPKMLEGGAAHFYDCYGFDTAGSIYKDDYQPYPVVTKPECYNVSLWYDTGSPGYKHFFYGGRCPDPEPPSV